MLKDILESCQYVVSCANHVAIDEKKIECLVRNMKNKELTHWLEKTELIDLDVKDIVNFLVIYDAIDFSFWGDPKWKVIVNDREVDGAFALLHCLLDYFKKNKKLDFETISKEEFAAIFEGNISIPLLDERHKILTNVSYVINHQMNGDFYTYTKHLTKDEELFKIILQYFPSFQDTRTYQGKTIYFYKLVQLLVSDILHLRKIKENMELDYTNLVGCADYKIPQVLRGLEILQYSKELGDIVDHKVEIKENDVYETEIRASTIVAIERIKEKSNDQICSIDINDIIWLLGQNKLKNVKPYHLTRTTSY